MDRVPPAIWHAFCLFISLLVFSLIVLNRSPNLLRPLSMALRTGFGLIIPAATLILYLAFRMPGRMSELSSMIITLSLFALALAGLWASGESQSTVLSGLIPLYDARAYYIDALNLINGQDFSIVSARRPLFPGLLAVLLSLTNYNLMAALAILAAITALSCYMMAREIQRSHGAEIAVFILMIVFLFYRVHSGISMTENLGVALGALGFGLLWRGTTSKSLSIMLTGLLITTLALNARAGAFFLLPLLIIWIAWFFRENARISWRALFLGAGIVALGFLLNLTLTRLIAVRSGIPFANFSYTLYGLASGGKSWAYVYEVHPEIGMIQEPEQSIRIYQLAFELMRENPWQTVKGALFNWQMLFSDSWYNIYSYVGGETWAVTVMARWGMYLLGMLGIGSWLMDRKDPIKSLIMVLIIGVFISVPFLPPTDAYRMRPYAASIVVLAALPAIGLKFFLEKIGANIPERMPDFDSVLPIMSFGLILTSILLVGPLIVKFIAQPVNFTLEPCTSGLDSIVIRYDHGTYVNIKKQNAVFMDWMPDYHIGLFRKNSHSLADTNMIEWTGTIEPGHTVLVALDYQSSQGIPLVVPTTILPAHGSLLQICGQYNHDYGSSIFYGEEAITLPW
jgi:hypothetical protein